MPFAIENEKFKYYVAGFVDGEGCFGVSFRKLDRLKIKIETRVSFSIAQKESAQNYRLLLRIRNLFNGGGIRKDNTGCFKYETRSIAHIQKHVIPFFKKYRLLTSKSIDWDYFCEICSLVASGKHLSKSGLKRIFQLSENMNLAGQRRYKLFDLLSLLEKVKDE